VAFRDLPINKKISRSILFTSITALILSSVAIISYEWRSFRKTAIEELIGTADVIGTNSTGALAFGDTNAAHQILSSLRDQTSIIAGRLFTSTGTVFATYSHTAEYASNIPSAPQEDEANVSEGHLKIFRSIRYREDKIGTVYLESDLRQVYLRLWRYMGILFAVTALLIPVVFLISRRLQKIISNPIEELAAVAHEVALHKRYSVRAQAHGQDEVGTLTKTFNEMLATIEERDRQLVKQAEELWRSNKELEQFAYVSSHDLQEPLRKITTYSQLLEAKFKGQLDEEAAKFISNICLSVTRMHNLIKDLLTYSRMSRQDTKMEKVDLNQSLKGVIGDLESSIVEKRAEIQTDQLPVVEGNPVQMQQLFQNLLTNAIKFQGSETPKVRVSCERKDGEWVIGVHDNGIGIEPKYSNQIFNVFQRLHARDAYPGTGIGLAICKKIVEQQNGRIWVESELGKGAHFYFTWPIGGATHG
jgi:signal transduction histidine kinase